jgi:hypothetical protein
MRGASNEKIKKELGWHPLYTIWRQGFFKDDVTVVAPGEAK